MPTENGQAQSLHKQARSMTRTVVHGHLYAKAYDQLKAKHRRFFDIQAAIDWAVHTNAKELCQLWPDQPNIRMLKTDAIDDTPAFRILVHIISDQEAELVAIAEAPEDDAAD